MPAVRFSRHLAGRVGSQGDHHRGERDAGPDDDAQAVRAQEASQGRAHRRLSTHDRPDRRSHRNSRRTRS